MQGEEGFCGWKPWSGRSVIPRKNLSGIYFIALSKRTLKISESTTNSSPASEIPQAKHCQIDFSSLIPLRSVRPGHSGGNTFRMNLLETTPLEYLWISACPVDMGAPYTTAYIKYLERKLLCEFVCTWGRYPECNLS